MSAQYKKRTPGKGFVRIVQKCAYHIEFKKEEHKEQDYKTIVQEKIKLEHHSKKNYEE